MITYCQKSKFNYRHGVDGSQTIAKFPILCNKVPILSSYMRMTHQLVGSLPFQPSQDSTHPILPSQRKKWGNAHFIIHQGTPVRHCTLSSQDTDSNIYTSGPERVWNNYPIHLGYSHCKF